jgi:hypothetical protein
MRVMWIAFHDRKRASQRLGQRLEAFLPGREACRHGVVVDGVIRDYFIDYLELALDYALGPRLWVRSAR